MTEGDRRRFNHTFARALERTAARTGKTQKDLATEIADEQVRARRLPAGTDRVQERAKAAVQWQKRLSAWKRDRLPQDVGELRLALGVVDSDGSDKDWIARWMAARRDRSSFGLAEPEHQHPTTPAPTPMAGGRGGLAHAVANWREPLAAGWVHPQPGGEPVERPSPARTDRWRLSSIAANASLNRMHNQQMPRPSRISDSNAEQQQPTIRICMAVGCKPLPPDLLTRLQRQERLLAFLNDAVVRQLVGGLTCLEDGMTWTSCGSHGPDHLGAALIVDTDEAVPTASIWLDLPRPDSAGPSSDESSAELVLEIRPRARGGMIAPPATPAAWRTHLARILALAGAFAGLLDNGLATTTYDEPATEIAIWMNTNGDLAQLVDIEGIPTEPGTHRSSWFGRYVIADAAGRPITDVVQTFMKELADDFHVQDDQEFLGQPEPGSVDGEPRPRPASMLKGAVGLATPPPTTGTGHALRGWRLAGYVEDFGDTPVRDVQVRLVSQDGRELPTPALYRPILNPGERWDFSWSVGWPFAPPPRPGPATLDDQLPRALSVPKEISQPLDRPQLQIIFTAVDGTTWAQSAGGAFGAVTPAPILPSEQAYARAREYLDGREGADLDEVRPVVADLLVRAVQLAVDERLGSQLGPEIGIPDVVGALLDDNETWTIAPEFDDRTPQALARLAGALVQLDGHVLRVAEHAAGPGRADYLHTFSEQTCAAMTTLAGLTYTPKSPPEGPAGQMPLGAPPQPRALAPSRSQDSRTIRQLLQAHQGPIGYDSFLRITEDWRDDDPRWDWTLEEWDQDMTDLDADQRMDWERGR